MSKLWRDLEIGETQRVGDRFLDNNHNWVTIEDKHLGFSDVVNECSYPSQREVAHD